MRFIRKIWRGIGSRTLDPELQKNITKAVTKAVLKSFSDNNGDLKKQVARTVKTSDFAPKVTQKGLNSYRAILHMGDAMAGSVSAYKDWRQSLKESDVDVLILFRHLARYETALKEFPDDDFAFAKTDVDVDQVVKACENVKAAIATTLTGNFLTMMRYDHMRPIFIGHGDSDKVSSSRRAMRAFDEIWVAGEAHRDRLAPILMGVPTKVVGRPQVKFLLDGTSPVGTSATYLPTWEGNLEEADYSSLSIARDIIEAIACISDAVTVKFHPSSGWRRTEFNADRFDGLPENVALASRTISPLQIMQTSAFCVADVSSIVTDWVVTGRPIFLFDAGKPRLQTRIPLEQYCYVFRSADELKLLLQEVIVEGNDHLHAARDAASHYLVSRSETLSDRFQAALKEL
jgi:hypothetical protein